MLESDCQKRYESFYCFIIERHHFRDTFFDNYNFMITTIFKTLFYKMMPNFRQFSIIHEIFFSFEYINLWPKIYLIMYPFVEKLTSNKLWYTILNGILYSLPSNYFKGFILHLMARKVETSFCKIGCLYYV